MTARATFPKPDATFSETSLAGSRAWVLHTIGRAESWFAKNRRHLEQDGFPKPDALLGLWIKADVRAWMEKRRQVKDAQAQKDAKGEVNTDAL